ncbi:hypothetical protein [Roseivivax isoporae]|uniref:Uncharacterized protein n=1 Tax=Roseivivax isoporae LMG 25204 TaxID=1449351 RepID=X7F424_9RHOB|nr:hypothetical protein [Roseivivax isoporae]ETX26856.1 hypothetical protein RISW2_18850 [Roseivivax isoporae LMG 25204]
MAKAASTARVHVTLSQDHTFRVDTSTKRTLPAGWTGYVSEKVAKEIEKERHGKRTPGADIPDAAEAAPAPKPGEKGPDGSDTVGSGAGADTAAAASGSDATAGGSGADQVIV